MQSALERRLAIYYLLQLRGKITHEQLLSELRPEFDVSMSTIRRDIDYLCLEHDVTILRGRKGGIVLKPSMQYRWKSSTVLMWKSIQSNLTDEAEIRLVSDMLDLNFQEYMMVKKLSHV